MRKPRVKCLLPGRRTALTVCQAISIAMTVVLPAPVASFSASRIEFGVRVALTAFRLSSSRLPDAELRRDLGQPDRRFDRLDLTEERPDAAELVMPPVLEQPRGLRRHLPLARFGSLRHVSTCARTSLMIEVRSYCLLLRRQAFAFVEDQLLLTAARDASSASGSA